MPSSIFPKIGFCLSSPICPSTFPSMILHLLLLLLLLLLFFCFSSFEEFLQIGPLSPHGNLSNEKVPPPLPHWATLGPERRRMTKIKIMMNSSSSLALLPPRVNAILSPSFHPSLLPSSFSIFFFHSSISSIHSSYFLHFFVFFPSDFLCQPMPIISYCIVPAKYVCIPFALFLELPPTQMTNWGITYVK